MKLKKWQKQILKDMQEANPLDVPVHKGKEMDLFLKYIAEKFPELHYIYFVAESDEDFIQYQKSKKPLPPELSEDNK